MNTNIENLAIVEKKNVDQHAAIQQPAITSIVRTYLSRARAEEDIDLLRQYGPTTSSFEIVTVEHIDA